MGRLDLIRTIKARPQDFVCGMGCFDHALGTGEFLRISTSDNILPI